MSPSAFNSRVLLNNMGERINLNILDSITLCGVGKWAGFLASTKCPMFMEFEAVSSTNPILDVLASKSVTPRHGDCANS